MNVNYSELNVNHKMNFVDPDSGDHITAHLIYLERNIN